MRVFQKGQVIAELVIPGKSGANINIALVQLENLVSPTARRLRLAAVFLAAPFSRCRLIPEATQMQQRISKPGTFLLDGIRSRRLLSARRWHPDRHRPDAADVTAEAASSASTPAEARRVTRCSTRVVGFSAPALSQSSACLKPGALLTGARGNSHRPRSRNELPCGCRCASGPRHPDSSGRRIRNQPRRAKPLFFRASAARLAPAHAAGLTGSSSADRRLCRNLDRPAISRKGSSSSISKLAIPAKSVL